MENVNIETASASQLFDKYRSVFFEIKNLEAQLEFLKEQESILGTGLCCKAFDGEEVPESGVIFVGGDFYSYALDQEDWKVSDFNSIAVMAEEGEPVRDAVVTLPVAKMEDA